jgi:NaMN:DMB phosphoribosyltransferase
MAKGATLVRDIAAAGCNVLAFGEMGIGNTASASLLTHCITGLPLADCVGRGTGLDDAGLERKRALLAQALAAWPERPRAGRRRDRRTAHRSSPASVASKSPCWPAPCWPRRKRA